MSRFRKGTTDHDGDGKMGGSMKEARMAKAPKKAAPKPRKAPAETAEAQAAESIDGTERDAAEQAAFDQGRRARSVSITRAEDPHGKSSKLQAHWQAGWDFEDDQRGG